MSLKKDQSMFFDERNNIEIQNIRVQNFKIIVIFEVK